MSTVICLMQNIHAIEGQLHYSEINTSWLFIDIIGKDHTNTTHVFNLGDTILCNGTERNETKRNDLVSCFSNYYRDITILTKLFRFVSEFLRFVSCFSNFLQVDCTQLLCSDQDTTDLHLYTVQSRYLSVRWMSCLLYDTRQIFCLSSPKICNVLSN